MLLLRVFLGCIIIFASHLGSNTASGGNNRNRNKLFLSTHSNFLRSTYTSSGRSSWALHKSEVFCRNNASICSDPVRNPKGGICCYNWVCKQVTSDVNNCGGCNRACGYGLSCCKGRCVNLMTDPFHCGGCDVCCKHNVSCEFGLCGYAAEVEPQQDPESSGKRQRFPKQW